MNPKQTKIFWLIISALSELVQMEHVMQFIVYLIRAGVGVPSHRATVVVETNTLLKHNLLGRTFRCAASQWSLSGLWYSDS